jgi:hypothetical protein
MGKKIRKLHKLLPDQVDPPSHAVRLGAETSRLPQPLRAAVDASGRWKVPRFLREELAIAIIAYGHPGPSDALVGRSRRRTGRSGARLSREEWRVLARARADEITAEANSHPLFRIWLAPHGPEAWQGLRNTLRGAIEAFAGHQGDLRRQRFESEPCGIDWRWLFPPEPKGEKDLHGRPAFEEPMHRALWSWIRHGDNSLTDPSETLSKRQIGKRITALRDTIIGDCSGGRSRIRKGGLLQVLAESFEPGNKLRQELVVAGSRERADGTRISPAGLPMNVIEPLLAGKKEEKLDPIGDAIRRNRIRCKLGLALG